MSENFRQNLETLGPPTGLGAGKEAEHAVESFSPETVASVGETAVHGAEGNVIPLLTGPQKTWLSKIAGEEDIERFKKLTVDERENFVDRLTIKYRTQPVRRATPESKEIKIQQLKLLMQGVPFQEIGELTGESKNRVTGSVWQLAKTISRNFPQKEIGRLIGVANGTEPELSHDHPDYVPPTKAERRSVQRTLVTLNQLSEARRETLPKDNRSNERRFKVFDLDEFLAQHPDLPRFVLEGRYSNRDGSKDREHLHDMAKFFKEDHGIMARVKATHGVRKPVGIHIPEDDPLNDFLHEVGHFRLLKREEETELMRILNA